MSNLNTHSTNNVVYYIGVKGDDHVKIGTTKNLAARLRSLSTARADGDRLIVLATEPGTYALEQQRHAQFAGSRVHGEWFTLTPELQEHIDRLALRVNPAYIRGYDEGFNAALSDSRGIQLIHCIQCDDDGMPAWNDIEDDEPCDTCSTCHAQAQEDMGFMWATHELMLAFGVPKTRDGFNSLPDGVRRNLIRMRAHEGFPGHWQKMMEGVEG